MEPNHNKESIFPKSSVACVSIVALVSTASTITFLFGLGFQLQNDPEVVINEE